ncbi:hypothetical protein [Rhodoplanes azumiensis]|uniref:Porin n=1 Tax=Rhodoplanes azumiensis TaxID=1897628 RepID=A0ABW5AMN3_9BRAD
MPRTIRRPAGRPVASGVPVGVAGGAALALAVLICSTGLAVAQAAGSGERREAIIGGGGAPSSMFQRCIDVEVGGDRGFGCLNEQLRREVDRVHPSLNLPPLDAGSSDLRVGNVNQAAVQQQYGRNFGVSAYPYRPPPPVYAIPRR